MENTVLTYRTPGGMALRWDKSFSVNHAGVVLYLSELSQTFIPWHRVIGIEQTFTNSMLPQERYEKSLGRKFRG